MDTLIKQVNDCTSDAVSANKLIEFIWSKIHGLKKSKLLVLYGRGSNGKSTFIEYFLKFRLCGIYQS